MAISKEQIIEQLRKVENPRHQRDIVSLNQVRHVAYCDGVASVTLRASQEDAAGNQPLREAVGQAVRDMGEEIKQVYVAFEDGSSVAAGDRAGDAATRPGRPGPTSAATRPGRPGPTSAPTRPGRPGPTSAPTRPGRPGPTSAPSPGSQTAARQNNPLPGVKHIVAVGAGKGGVGKSTIAVNLAVGLARAGHATGLLDADIYGPSLPTMLGINGVRTQTRGKQIVPFEVHGIKAISVGSLVDEEKPLIWRGPMAHGAFRQLSMTTLWGELDYLVIDLPPGTGDVPLTMSQLLPLTGAVVVCTPQKVAQDDARRAVRMFEQLNIDVLGIVENMSYFIGDDGKEYDIFGRGGAERMAGLMGLPFLGAVPINMALRANSDAGDPTANFKGDDGLSGGLESLVGAFTGQITVHEMAEEFEGPTISVRE